MGAVNVVGAVRVTNSVLPRLRRSRGRIVNVASLAGKIALPTQTAYSTSKFAMEGYSDGLRRELFDWGVTVHIIEPGVFNKTGLYQTYHDGVKRLWDGISEEVKQDYGEAFRDGIASRAGQALADLGNKDVAMVPAAMLDALTATKP